MSPPPEVHRARPVAVLGESLRTLAVAALGGWLAELAGLPAAWLLGAAVAVTLAALLGVATRIPRPVQLVALACVGLAIGSRVTEDTLSLLVAAPLSFLVLLAAVAVAMAASVLYLERAHGFDRATALLAASPGSMMTAAAMAADGYGNLRQMLVVQSLRLLFLTAVVPLTLAGVAPSPGVAPVTMTLGTLALLGVLVLGFGLVLERLRLPVATMLAGLVVGAVAHAGGWVEGVVPAPVTAAAFLVVGAVIGARFRRLGWRDLRELAQAALVVTLVASIVSGAAALLVATILDLPFGQVWIAYAPGGVEAMAAMALAFDVDAAYVAAHHVLRIVVLSLALAYLLGRTERSDRAGGA